MIMKNTKFGDSVRFPLRIKSAQIYFINIWTTSVANSHLYAYVHFRFTLESFKVQITGRREMSNWENKASHTDNKFIC